MDTISMLHVGFAIWLVLGILMLTLLTYHLMFVDPPSANYSHLTWPFRSLGYAQCHEFLHWNIFRSIQDRIQGYLYLIQGPASLQSGYVRVSLINFIKDH